MDTQAIFHALPEIFTQLLAFLIAFWILKSYAFKPILRVLDERRKTIEDSFSDIEKKKKDVEALEKDYRLRLDKIEETARVKIQEASNVGLALAKELQEKARLDSQKLLERAHAEIKQDLANAKIGMRNEVVEISALMAEKVLKEKLSPQDHKKLLDDFIREMEKVA